MKKLRIIFSDIVAEFLTPTGRKEPWWKKKLRRAVCALEGHPTASWRLDSDIIECDWCGMTENRPRPFPETTYQTRRWDGEIRQFKTFTEAMKDAEDPEVWKVSFTLPNGERFRMVRQMGQTTFKYSNLMEEVATMMGEIQKY